VGILGRVLSLPVNLIFILLRDPLAMMRATRHSPMLECACHALFRSHHIRFNRSADAPRVSNAREKNVMERTAPL